MLVACVLPCRFFHASNPIKQGICVSLKIQFEIEKNCDALEAEDTEMHNDKIKMDINDPLCKFLEIQVEIFLKLLPSGNPSSK